MNNLEEFIKSSSQYVTPEDFEQGFIIAKFVSYSIYPKTYQGKTSQTVGYKLLLKGEDHEKTLESASAKLAKLMNSVQPGQVIKLTREGQGFATTWQLIVVANTSNALAESLPTITQEEYEATPGQNEFESDELKNIPF